MRDPLRRDSETTNPRGGARGCRTLFAQGQCRPSPDTQTWGGSDIQRERAHRKEAKCELNSSVDQVCRYATSLPRLGPRTICRLHPLYPSASARYYVIT